MFSRRRLFFFNGACGYIAASPSVSATVNTSSNQSGSKDRIKRNSSTNRSHRVWRAMRHQQPRTAHTASGGTDPPSLGSGSLQRPSTPLARARPHPLAMSRWRHGAPAAPVRLDGKVPRRWPAAPDCPQQASAHRPVRHEALLQPVAERAEERMSRLRAVTKLLEHGLQNAHLGVRVAQRFLDHGQVVRRGGEPMLDGNQPPEEWQAVR